jgi:hypothetical protein
VNHINLDALPEPVRELLRDAVAAPDGSVLEENGRQIGRVLPLPRSNGTPAGEWTSAKNRRRGELIDRKIAGTITPEERVELEDLHEQLDRFVDRVAPLPVEPVRRMYDALLEKVIRTAADPAQ